MVDAEWVKSNSGRWMTFSGTYAIGSVGDAELVVEISVRT